MSKLRCALLTSSTFVRQVLRVSTSIETPRILIMTKFSKDNDYMCDENLCKQLAMEASQQFEDLCDKVDNLNVICKSSVEGEAYDDSNVFFESKEAYERIEETYDASKAPKKKMTYSREYAKLEGDGRLNKKKKRRPKFWKSNKRATMRRKMVETSLLENKSIAEVSKRNSKQRIQKARDRKYKAVAGVTVPDRPFTFGRLMQGQHSNPRTILPNLGHSVREHLDVLSDLRKTFGFFHSTRTGITERLQYSASDMGVVELLLSRMEDMIAMFVVFQQTSDVRILLSTIHLYLKTIYTDKSMLRRLMGIISLYVSHMGDTNTMESVADSDDSEDANDNDDVGINNYDLSAIGEACIDGIKAPSVTSRVSDSVVKAFKMAMSNWKELRKGAVGRQIGNIMTILVTFGVMHVDSDDVFQINNVKLFACKAWNLQKGCLSFVEMITETCVFFIDRIWYAIKTGDIRGALFQNELAEYDEMYANLVAYEPLSTTDSVKNITDSNGKRVFADLAEFRAKLDEMICHFEDMLKKDTLPAPARTVMVAKLVKLKQVDSNIILAVRRENIRVKPFAFSLYAGSGVGKTYLNNHLVRVALVAGGFSADPQYLVTFADGNKYDDVYQCHHTAMTFDDFANTKAEKVQEAPTKKIIDIVNNVPCAVHKAKAEDKGKLMYDLKVVSLTTNVKGLNASVYSNCPESVLRRLNLIITVFLKDDFKSPDGTIDPKCFDGNAPPDAWCFNVERVKIINSVRNKDKFEYNLLKSQISFQELCAYVHEQSTEHFEEQNAFIERQRKDVNKKICPHGWYEDQCAKCKDKKLGEIVVPVEVETAVELDYSEAVKHKAVSAAYDPSASFAFNYGHLLAQCGFFLFASYIMHSLSKKCTRALTPFEDYVRTRNRVINNVNVAYHEADRNFSDLIQVFEDHKWKILGCAGAVVAIKAIRASCKAYSSVSTGFAPVVSELDHENVWKKVETEQIGTTHFSSTTSQTDLVNLVSKNIGFVYFSREDGLMGSKCNCLPMQDSMWLVPEHAIPKSETFKVKIVVGNESKLGMNITKLLSQEQVYRFPNKDLALINVKACPVKNLCKFLPLDEPVGNELCSIIHRKEDGSIVTGNVKYHSKRQISTTHKLNGESSTHTFNAALYNCCMDIWEVGTCLSTMVSNTNNPYLAGFQLGIDMVNKEGSSSWLTLREYTVGYDALSKNNFSSVSAFQLDRERYDLPLIEVGGKIPKRNAVNYMAVEDGQEPSLTVLGASGKTRTFKSHVVNSIITDDVSMEMGLPCEHGPPPQMNHWQHPQRDLNLIAHPKGNFNPIIWQCAVDDLKRTFHRSMDKIGRLDEVHVYDMDTAVNGKVGMAMVDKVNMNASMGWPINSPKNKVWKNVEDDESNPYRVYEPDSATLGLCEKIEDSLKSGHRYNTIFRAQLKDEATKLTKKKVRVFAGGEAAFLLVVRKYFLSSVRYMQQNWLDFECAVGINAYGPQWSQLSEYLLKHGNGRVIAGDYSAYDKRCTSEALMSAFDVLLEIPRRAGYDDEDLEIMRGCATEISFPIYEWFGAMVQAYGSNPSGHPLTVIINNIMNSLYIRYAYFSHFGKFAKPFSDHVALMCYGDDNIMGVSAQAQTFTHTVISKELAKSGIVYTDEDKTGKEVFFRKLEQCSFLKRGFRYSEDLKEWVGPIEVRSIAKSLHCRMSDSVETPEVLAIMSLNKANNEEFFLWGREIHEQRRKEMINVAKAHNLQDAVDLRTYDNLVEEYHARWHASDVETTKATDGCNFQVPS